MYYRFGDMICIISSNIVIKFKKNERKINAFYRRVYFINMIHFYSDFFSFSFYLNVFGPCQYVKELLSGRQKSLVTQRPMTGMC